MAIWLNGWTGDNAGSIVGREPNRLLLTMTVTDFAGPAPDRVVNFFGIPNYSNVSVSCLTPSARPGFVTSINRDRGTWSMELVELDVGGEAVPWDPGIHLFEVDLQGGGIGNGNATIATAVIDENLRRMVLPRNLGFGPSDQEDRSWILDVFRTDYFSGQ